MALISLATWKQTPRDDYYRGVQPIVIEVLSPSNTAAEMLDREAVCLGNGGREFWLIDPERRTVRVAGGDGMSKVSGPDGVITSGLLDHGIPVRDIFED